MYINVTKSKDVIWVSKYFKTSLQQNQIVFSLDLYTKYIQNVFGMRWINNKIYIDHKHFL